MSSKNAFRRFQIGPGAASLIMILVVVSMSALGILALYNARSDYQLSLRSADVAEQIYQLNDLAEAHLVELDAVLAASQTADETEYLAAVGAALPEGMTLDDRTVSWQEKLPSGRVLDCAVELEKPGSDNRFRWTSHVLYYESDEMDYEFGWN